MILGIDNFLQIFNIDLVDSRLNLIDFEGNFIESDAKSLSAGEDVILSNRKENNFQKIILRCSNGYGSPVIDSKECWNLLLNQACLKATQNLTLDIMNPYSLRNFIPIKESCRAIEFFLSQNKVYSGVVNVGSEETFTVSQIMDFVKERASLILSKNLEINILSKIPEKKKPTNLFFSFTVTFLFLP